jgi:type IV secretion system protein VirB10
MRLRPEPPRVTRLSRKVLAGLGLVASLGVGGALIYALQTRNGGNQGQELYSTDNRTTPDGLAGLPKDYSGVPRLGPPLPGDLGRPILNAQNGGQPVRRRASPQQRPPAPARRSSAARRSWKRPAPRGCSPPRRRGPPAPQQPRRAAPAPRPTSPASASRRSRRRPRRRIASSPSSTSRPTSAPSRPIGRRARSANVLQAGAVISAALITGIRSDLPGQITAQVTENVYDSPTGRSC